MGRLGFCFDMNRCIGCKACQVACKEENNLSPGAFFRRVETLRAESPSGKRYVSYSGACNHCARPACVKACPTGAMYVSEDGTVLHRDAGCIGCGRCVSSCPFQAVSLREETGYAQKCDACRQLRENGKNPICVDACPVRALRFGDLDDFRSNDGTDCEGRTIFLPDPGQTEPALIIRNAPPEWAAPASTTRLPETDCPMEQHETYFRDTDDSFVILGAGVAALSAARTIRRHNRTARIQLFEAESTMPYSRPMLSKASLRGFSMQAYPLVTEAWLKDNRIELISGRRVAALDADKHLVTLDSGEQFCYDTCIYALGAECFIPPISGAEKAGVFSLRRSTDVRKLRTALVGVEDAVVIGGGAVGLEAAWQCREHGIRTTVIEAAPYLLEKSADPYVSAALGACLERAGIRAMTGAAVKAIQGAGAVNSVLVDQETIPAQAVILSTGIRANTEIAKQAGISAARFVAVDEYMQTSVKDVFACGDCAAYNGKNNATWLHAARQGEIAGLNAVGRRIAFQAEEIASILHFGGTTLFSVGDWGTDSVKHAEILHGYRAKETQLFRINPGCTELTRTEFSFLFSAGRLIGAAAIGEMIDSDYFETSVKAHMKKSLFLQTVLERGIVIDNG